MRCGEIKDEVAKKEMQSAVLSDARHICATVHVHLVSEECRTMYDVSHKH